MSWLLGLVIGCGAEDVELFEVHLQPRVLSDQDPFSGEAEVKLLVAAPGEDPQVRWLGPPLGAYDQPALEPLQAGTLLGLSAELASEADQIELQLQRGYGQVPLAEAPQPGSVVDVPLLVLEVGRIGALARLRNRQISQLGAVAVLGSGDVLVFGGRADVQDSGPGGVVRLRDVHREDPEPEALGIELPDPLGLTATTVLVDGREQVLVTGGRSDWLALGGGSRFAGLYDPALDDWSWSSSRGLKEGRSEHEALLLDNGRVLLVGGYRQDSVQVGDRPSFELFDPETATSELFEQLPIGPVGFHLANLGIDGALVCGGAEVGQSGSTPLSACVRIDQQGSVFSAAELPIPLMEGAMVGLGDGRALITGGLDLPVDDNGGAPASSSAWIYANNLWTQAFDLVEGRAQHAAVRLATGDVLVFGGVGVGGVTWPVPESPRICYERFNLSSRTFEQVGCLEATGGAEVRVGVLGSTAAVLRGWEGQFGYSGGDALGLAGLGTFR